MDNIIEIKNLTKTFGKFTAVNRVSFKIKRGEILGFLGPNGAGKTTTIKMINGLLKISGGTIHINQMDAVKERKKVKRIMGYMSQKFSLYPLLTAYENIEFFSGISGLRSARIKEKWNEVEQMVEPAVLKQKVGDLPPGVRQKISLFVCLITDPEIIFLDEPTSGVDPEVRRNFWFEIYRLKKMGKTILVSTHNLDEVEYADRMLILHQGHLLMEGEPRQLIQEHGKSSIHELFRDAIVGSGINAAAGGTEQ